MRRMKCLMVGLLVAGATATAHAAAVGSDYRDTVLSLNPVGYWEFEGAGAPIDSSGNGNHAISGVGAAQSGQSSAHAALGNAYDFSPTQSAGEYIYKVSNADNAIFYGGAFSVSFWFNATKTNSTMLLMGDEALEPTGFAWDARILSIQGGFLRMHGSHGTGVGFGPATAIQLNKWHFVTLTFDGPYPGSPVNLYLDGELALTNVYGHGVILPSNYDLLIGGTASSSGTYSGFEGALDELALFNYALSANDIRAMYQAAVPEPASAVLMGFGALLMMRRSRRR